MLSLVIFGFCFFIRFSKPENLIDNFDIIVVLTGREQRIPAAIEVLKKYPNKELFISGVNPTFSKKVLLRRYNISNKYYNKVILDKKSRTTIENFQNIKDWLSNKIYDRVLLITSYDHMRRSLIYANNFMPNITFIDYPVDIPINTDITHTIFTIFIEYLKFIFIKTKHIF